MKRLIVAFICLLCAIPCAARIITVDDDGPADFNNIQAAIDDSNDGDIVEVNIGTYTGPGNRDIDFLGKAITVRSANPNDPNVVEATIIEHGSADVPIFYFHQGEDSNSVVDGFTLTTSAPESLAIWCEASSPTIRNCTVRDCWPAAIYLFASRANIANCIITDNGGSGVFFHGSPTISNCTISDNLGIGIIFYNETGEAVVVRISNCTITGNDGGGIYCGGGGSFPIDLGITDCNISGNSTEYDGGGICCDDVFVGTITMTLTNSTISHNRATGNGGGICCPETTSPNSLTITDCTISGNEAYNGGGLYDCDWLISGCTITDNSAEWCGGGLHNCDGPITSSFISRNSAALEGGGFYNCDGPISNCIISGNTGGRCGGLLRCGGSVTNCGILGNSTLWPTGWSAMGAPTGVVSNCIIWGNTEPAVGHSCTIIYSCVQSGYSGLGNVDVDPCFVEGGKWVDVNDPNTVVEPNDSNAVWIDGDYHLKSQGWYWHVGRKVWDWDEDETSRCIDAGNPGSPLGGELLSVPDDPNNDWGENLRINMGAYGGTAEASMPPYDWALLSDVTNDGIVDFVDFAHLADLYTDQDDELPADFDRDGDVDYGDLHLLTEDWLKETSWPH